MGIQASNAATQFLIISNHEAIIRIAIRCNKFQGRSEGTSSVALEVLIIKSVHLQLFNVKYKFVYQYQFVYLQLFNVKYKFIELQMFDVSNVCFPKNIFFASRRERMFMDARP